MRPKGAQHTLSNERKARNALTVQYAWTRDLVMKAAKTSLLRLGAKVRLVQP